MRRLTKFLFLLLAGWSVTLTSQAQTGVAIPIFSFSGSATNGGAAPEGNLVVGPDGGLYGTTQGANTNYGTIFKITTGGDLTTLVIFNGTNGALPIAGLTLAPDGNFYGTTEYGGTNFGIPTINAGLGAGTAFRLTTNGLLTTLATFAVTNGQTPHGGLTWGPGGLLYGTAARGGPFSSGTIFSITTDGILTMLTNFNNANGNNPIAGLTLGPDGNLYGVTQSGGAHAAGTVFRVTPSGSLTNIYHFGSSPADGASPETTLTLGPDGKLYGATDYTSLADPNGTVFKITTNGTLTTLVNWDFVDGGHPVGSLTLGPDGIFYGTTYFGGNSVPDKGIVYSVSTNGAFSFLVSFAGPNGAYPIAGVTLGPDNNLYGVTSGGGAAGYGLVYRVGLPPSFISNPASQSVIIGNPATFNSQPFGGDPYTFQWRSNSIPVTGATNSSLTVPQVFYQADNAQFRVVVTNSYGSVTSQVATLSVVLQPNFSALLNNGGGNYTVIVGSFPSSTNHLWATTNLNSPWQQIAPIITDANGMGQYLDTDTTDIPAKFYQLSYP